MYNWRNELQILYSLDTRDFVSKILTLSFRQLFICSIISVIGWLENQNVGSHLLQILDFQGNVCCRIELLKTGEQNLDFASPCTTSALLAPRPLAIWYKYCLFSEYASFLQTQIKIIRCYWIKPFSIRFQIWY